MQFSFSTRSHEETVNAGRSLGRLVETGCVVGLIGDLGAGKTCFMKGVANGLNGVPEKEVTSPTFTILQAYEGVVPLYHFDAYRLEGVEDLDDIGFDDYVYGQGVSFIEWADNISKAIPEERMLIEIKLTGDENRLFKCSAQGEKHEAVLNKFIKSQER
jgi:tRNA threonylcarbamoyladenosine biosynthesis protein TsaE